MRTTMIAMAGVLALAGCATRMEIDHDGPPSLAIAAGQPAPAQARFYGACIAQAQANGAYDRIDNTLRYSCTGDEARAFFDGLAAYSAAQRSEYVEGMRTYRFTNALQDDTAGVDYCWREGGNYQCTVVLNVGEFLEQ